LHLLSGGLTRTLVLAGRLSRRGLSCVLVLTRRSLALRLVLARALLPVSLILAGGCLPRTRRTLARTLIRT
jgi:hypothetical protein